MVPYGERMVGGVNVNGNGWERRVILVVVMMKGRKGEGKKARHRGLLVVST